MATISIQVLIEKQLEKIENQRQVDDFYKQFLTVYFDELTRLKMFKNAGPPKNAINLGGVMNCKNSGMTQSTQKKP